MIEKKSNSFASGVVPYFSETLYHSCCYENRLCDVWNRPVKQIPHDSPNQEILKRLLHLTVFATGSSLHTT
jgi:hypothetical protein